MNSQSDLLFRLLKLFPVKFVKDTFECEGTVQDEYIRDVLKKYSAISIEKSVLENLNFTKQHIHIIELTTRYNIGNFDEASFPFPIINRSAVGGTLSFNCMPITEYEIFIVDQNVRDTIKFIQPVKVSIKGKRIIIQTTIIEKKISSYVNSADKVVELSRKNTEETFVAKIVDHFKLDHIGGPCDLNKGIKAMWVKDDIDCRSLKYKNSHSVASEIMDEEFTFKQKYPAEFLEIIKKPLNKTLYKYLKSDELLSKLFLVDASKGFIAITNFPDNENQVDHVINTILQNN